MSEAGTLRIDHSPQQERFEAVLVSDGSGEDEVVGYLDYVSEPYQVVITHTVVREPFTGRGYAATLVRTVLEDIRTDGKMVVPVCSYVQKYIREHPEFAEIAVAVPQ